MALLELLGKYKDEGQLKAAHFRPYPFEVLRTAPRYDRASQLEQRPLYRTETSSPRRMKATRTPDLMPKRSRISLEMVVCPFAVTRHVNSNISSIVIRSSFRHTWRKAGQLIP